MSRKHKSSRPEDTATIPATTVKLPYGDKRGKHSHPSAGLYVYYGDRFMYQSFDHQVTAKHFLEMIIAGDDYKWGMWPNDKIGKITGITPEPMLITARGVYIRGAGLEQAMEYEFQNNEELHYIFPSPYFEMYSTWTALGPVSHEPKQLPKAEPVYDPDTGELVKPAPKPAREPAREPKPVKPKVDKTGLVLVADIATTLGADPKHVRAALRKAGVPKPAVGWAFPKADVPRITKLIKDNLK